MAYGDIVLADNEAKNLISSAIKWFTQSIFSHSFVTMPDTLNIPMCIEAAEGGVDFQRFDTAYRDNTSEGYQRWNIKIDQSIKDAALVSVLNDLETGYGYLEYPWFMWRRINLLFGRDIKSHNNWNSDGMICSQVCVAYLKACGLQSVLAGYGNGSIAPQDLQNIFKAHPELFELVESVRLS
jgi:hypothetical protein